MLLLERWMVPLFSVWINESYDMSTKEQMAIVLHSVDKNGYVVECFISIEHVYVNINISLTLILMITSLIKIVLKAQIIFHIFSYYRGFISNEKWFYVNVLN